MTASKMTLTWIQLRCFCTTGIATNHVIPKSKIFHLKVKRFKVDFNSDLKHSSMEQIQSRCVRLIIDE